jgi:hypothetical protein
MLEEPGGDCRADLVYREQPNGGACFSVGSLAWCGALTHRDGDNNVSRITDNVLRRFSGAGSEEPTMTTRTVTAREAATRRAASLKLKDRRFGDEWLERVQDRWNYADLVADARWREDWISFDGVVHHAASDRLYLGITSFAADIFKAFDLGTRSFADLGFARVADRYDAKFHRSMELTRDGRSLYAATALLHDIDRYHDAPGGGIFRFDTASGDIEKLGIPLPHVYIQSIALDERRGVIYCQQAFPEVLTAFDLATRTARVLGPIGAIAFAQGENVVLDDDGCAWCGWGATRAWQNEPGVDSFRLCKYDPRQDRIVYFPRGLPRADGSPGFAKVEGLFNLGGGCLFASGDNGSIYRVDPADASAECLGTPIRDRRSRLASLRLAADGFAYGITGREGDCRLLRLDPRSGRHELLGGRIVDGDDEPMWQCHDLAITPDGTIYAGENDHPRRSSYLWEIRP